jgi:plastocyanin
MPKLLAVGVALLSLAACGGSGDNGVEMTSDQAFAPAEITVAAGDTISFKNTSSEAHTVTAYDEEIPDGADYFSSGSLPSEEAARDELAAALIAAGDTYEFTFEEPGTYRYFCIPHEEAGMKGTIVVEG